MDITPALDSFYLHPELKNGTKNKDSTKKENKKKAALDKKQKSRVNQGSKPLVSGTKLGNAFPIGAKQCTEF